jgi:pyruvate/2-oxoglutarate dehydrogenase complex dihydrolipoamide acyltransferase (E2) component
LVPSIDVTFPRISENYPEAGGTLLAWSVADGDTVQPGQVLAEVSVNKAVGEIEAPVAGTITLLVAVDEVVLQGHPVARINS